MERKSKGKGFTRKPGAPFGMMIPKLHKKAHKRMGMNEGKDKEEDSLKKTEEVSTEEPKTGKAVENKKEE